MPLVRSDSHNSLAADQVNISNVQVYFPGILHVVSALMAMYLWYVSILSIVYFFNTSRTD